MRHEMVIQLLRLVNADRNQVSKLIVVESFDRRISISWIILLEALIGVQRG